LSDNTIPLNQERFEEVAPNEIVETLQALVTITKMSDGSENIAVEGPGESFVLRLLILNQGLKCLGENMMRQEMGGEANNAEKKEEEPRIILASDGSVPNIKGD